MIPASNSGSVLTSRIAGDSAPDDAGDLFESRDPARQTLLAVLHSAQPEDVDAAVAAAWKAYRGAWGTLSLGDRARLLRRVAEAIERRAAELASIESLDAGKPISECHMLVQACAEAFWFASDMAQKVRGDRLPSDPGAHVYSTIQPYGVVGTIVPWNYPLNTAVSKIAPALAMGNAVILKPAEQTPLSALLLADVFDEAGLPAGAFSVLVGGPPVGRALAAHVDLPLVSFTGSTAVGREIARGAADRMQRTVLELGGKSAVVVFDDAPLDAVTDAVVQGFTTAAGQLCSASTRLIVQQGVYEELLERVAARVATLRIGDPQDDSTEIGPLISAEHRERVSGYVARARERGCQPRLGGTALAPEPVPNGFYYAPTIIEEPDPTSELVREEIFGPVLATAPARSEEEAVRLANATPYGLAAYLWTSDLARAHRVAARLEAGSVVVNTFKGISAYGVPYGGWKDSGAGMEEGIEGALAFTRTKVVAMAIGQD